MSYAELYDMYLEGMNDVDEALAMYTPVSEYCAIFEADEPETQQKVQVNRNAEQKSQNGFMKIINAIKRIVHNVITSIRNFFDRAKLSAEQKKAYDTFKAACAKDPSLKNKKITVKAWEEFDKRGDELMREGEALLRQEAENNPTACQQFINKVEDYCKSTAGAAGSVLVEDILKKSMVKCPPLANKIQQDMMNHSKWCEDLEKSIGSKEYKKLEKYADKMKVKGKIAMGFARLGKKKYENLHDIVSTSLNAVNDLAHGTVTKDGARIIATAAKNETLQNNVIKPGMYVAKGAAGAVVKDKLNQANMSTTKQARYARNKKKLDNMSRKDGETQTEYERRVQKQQNKVDKLEVGREKEIAKANKKAAKGLDMSMGSFITGGRFPF